MKKRKYLLIVLLPLLLCSFLSVGFANAATTVIYEDDETFWSASANIVLTEELTEKQSGTSSLKINSTAGTGYFYHDYAGTEDFSGGDYLQFYFYGANTTDTILFTFTDSGSNYSRYTLTDDFVGWQLFNISKASLSTSGTPDFTIMKYVYVESLLDGQIYYLDLLQFNDATPAATPTPTPFASATPFPEGDMSNTDWWISILVVMLIIINIFLMMLPFALVRFTFGILSLFLCMLALNYQIPLSPYLQTAGLLISALAMLFSVRARE